MMQETKTGRTAGAVIRATGFQTGPATVEVWEGSREIEAVSLHHVRLRRIRYLLLAAVALGFHVCVPPSSAGETPAPLGLVAEREEVEDTLSRLDDEARRDLVRRYAEAPSEEQVLIRDGLEAAYHRLIGTDPGTARKLRDLHTELVAIRSGNAPLESLFIGVQFPHAAPDPLPIRQGDPSLWVASELQRRLGTDIQKLAIEQRHLTRQGIDFEGEPTLARLAAHPGYKRILDLPYRVMCFWAHGNTRVRFGQGITQAQQEALYLEFYAFTEYLLTTYSGSDKVFLIGNWEGDWLLGAKEVRDTEDCSPEAVKDMIAWFDARVRGVNDAKARTPHHGVQVFTYAEINHVTRPRTSGVTRLVNAVLPYTRVDFVSISSYEMQGHGVWSTGTAEQLRRLLSLNLEYVEQHLPPRDIPGKRVFIGEIGYRTEVIRRQRGFSEVQAEVEQARLALTSAALALEWGVPLWQWWALFDTGGDEDTGPRGFGLIDTEGRARRLGHELAAYFRWATAYRAEQDPDSGGTSFREAATRYLLQRAEHLAREAAVRDRKALRKNLRIRSR